MLLAVSAGGKRLCIGFSPGGSSTQIEVIELGTWRVLYSNRFSTSTGYNASFFASGEALCVNTGETGFLVDLRSGERRERPSTSGYRGSYHALADGLTLREDPDNSLVLERLPSYQELLRIPEPEMSALMVTADRRRVFRNYGSDQHWVECYMTEDLHRLWKRRIEIPGARWDLLHNYKGVLFTAPSADGSRVVLAGVDIFQSDEQKQAFVAMLDGNTGDEVERLPLNATAGLAISPNGKLLAIGKRARAGEEIELFLEIHDLASGALVAAATHERVPPGHWQAATAHFDGLDSGIAFTSDGAYVVSSGANSVKIWQLA